MAGNPRIDDLRKRLEKEPGSRLFAQLAEELRKDGELEEAIRVAREGLQKHPQLPVGAHDPGPRAASTPATWPRPAPSSRPVLKGAPDNILASRFLAECLEGLGDLQGAASAVPGDAGPGARRQARQARLEALEKGSVTAAPAPASAVAGDHHHRRRPAEPPPRVRPRPRRRRTGRPRAPSPRPSGTPRPSRSWRPTRRSSSRPRTRPRRPRSAADRPARRARTGWSAWPCRRRRRRRRAPAPSRPDARGAVAIEDEAAPVPEEPLELERPYESPATLWAGAATSAVAASRRRTWQHDFAEEFPPPERPVAARRRAAWSCRR